MMRYVVVALVLFNCTLVHCQSKSKPITEFSQKDLDGAILIDVRTPAEFKAGHLENAVNINWFDTDFSGKFAEFGKNDTLYLYCKKGGRSIKAQQLLDSLGYTNAVHLEGGYELWKTSH